MRMGVTSPLAFRLHAVRCVLKPNERSNRNFPQSERKGLASAGRSRRGFCRCVRSFDKERRSVAGGFIRFRTSNSSFKRLGCVVSSGRKSYPPLTCKNARMVEPDDSQLEHNKNQQWVECYYSDALCDSVPIFRSISHRIDQSLFTVTNTNRDVKKIRQDHQQTRRTTKSCYPVVISLATTILIERLSISG